MLKPLDKSARKTAASYEIREWRASDAEAWLGLQRASFGEGRAMTSGDWQQRFEVLDLPTRGMLALRAGQLCASYSGIPARTWFAGEERLCVQPVDLMVHPDLRGGLGAARLQCAVAEAFFERYGEGQGDLMHYGWPIAAARRFGRRMLGYQFVREELCLGRHVPSSSPEVPEVLELRETGEDLRWLWDRCAAEFGCSTIRDGAWARWRFLEHPSVEYRLLGLRQNGLLRGLAVVRRTPWHWPGTLALCDWLVPASEPEVAASLERKVLQLAADWGQERVVCLLPEWSAAFAWFQDQGWRVESTPYQLVVKSYDRRLDADWVRQQAWLTLADSDLV